MPTIFSHPAVTLIKPWFRSVPRSAVVAGAIASILPDIDVAAFAFGIPYSHTFGHRGFTHSILFALLASVALTAVVRRDAKTFAFIFLCAISHPLLDAMTNGGLGIAFFSPFSNARYFLPWRPIRASPIAAEAFFTARGVGTLVSEVGWVWGPFAIAWLIAPRKRGAAGS